MKPDRNFILMTCLLVPALYLPASTIASEGDVQATINGLEQALNDNNLVKLEKIYAEEAMVIPAADDVLRNGNAITRFWNTRLSEGKRHYNIDVIDLHVDDNIAYISALWSATVIRDGRSAEIYDGYMSNVLERETDGNWKIRVQNWN